MPSFMSSGAAFLAVAIEVVLVSLVIAEMAVNSLYERSSCFRRWLDKVCGIKATKKRH